MSRRVSEPRAHDSVRTRFMLETLTSLKAAKKESNRFLASLGKKRRREFSSSEVHSTPADISRYSHTSHCESP